MIARMWREMAMFLRLGAEMHFEFRGCDAASFGLFHCELAPVSRDSKRFDDSGGGGSGVDQGADGHIAADAGEGVEVAEHTLL